MIRNDMSIHRHGNIYINIDEVYIHINAYTHIHIYINMHIYICIFVGLYISINIDI
jgi:hypothetical protein